MGLSVSSFIRALLRPVRRATFDLFTDLFAKYFPKAVIYVIYFYRQIYKKYRYYSQLFVIYLNNSFTKYKKKVSEISLQ